MLKYSFKKGFPSNNVCLKASKVLKEATDHRLAKVYKGECTYVTYGETRGPAETRDEFAKFLTEGYGDKVLSDDLFITAGASTGLIVTLGMRLCQSNVLFCEDPTYFYAAKILQTKSDETISVPLDDDGLNVEELEKETISRYPKHFVPTKEQPYWSMLYCVPTYHNPTGICYSPERCQRIVQIARKYNILVFSEDIYNLLHYDKETQYPPKRLFSYDDRMDFDYKGNVISNSSCSKYFLPGIRLGWMEGPKHLMDILSVCPTLDSGGCLNTWGSGVMASALQLGLSKKFLDDIKEIYKEKMDICFEVLDNNLPPGCSYNKPKGGYYIWIKLPDSISGENILEFAEEKFSMDFYPGNLSSLSKRCGNNIRVSIAYVEKEDIQSAMFDLCACIKQYTELQK